MRNSRRSSRPSNGAALLVGALLVIGAAARDAVAATVPAPSSAPAAVRHLRLVRSSPAADTTLAASPDAIRLWLSEPAEAAASKIELKGSDSTVVALKPVTRGADRAAPLVATLAKPLAPGAYAVSWRAMSKDGHVVKGTYVFHVGASKGAAK